MTNPTLVTTPFAENGDKNTIPNVNSDPDNPQLASNDLGFPPITQQKVSLGGIPPERNDFNGILNLYGQHIVHLNKGLPYEFDAAFATEIGGYPLNARIMLANGDIVQSTIASNTNNPNLDMSGWYPEIGYLTFKMFGIDNTGGVAVDALVRKVAELSTILKIPVKQNGGVYLLNGSEDITFTEDTILDGSVFKLGPSFSGKVVLKRNDVETLNLTSGPAFDALKSVGVVAAGRFSLTGLTDFPYIDYFSKITTSQPLYIYRGITKTVNFFTRFLRESRIENAPFFQLDLSQLSSIYLQKAADNVRTYSGFCFDETLNNVVGNYFRMDDSNHVVIKNTRYMDNSPTRRTPNQTRLTINNCFNIVVDDIAETSTFRNADDTFAYTLTLSSSYDVNVKRMRSFGAVGASTGSNNCSRVTFDDCQLTRIDFHEPCYDWLKIRNCNVGQFGITATMIGDLIIDGGSLLMWEGGSRAFVASRSDIGGFCYGDLHVTNLTLTGYNGQSAYFIEARGDGILPNGSPIKAVMFNNVYINGLYNKTTGAVPSGLMSCDTPTTLLECPKHIKVDTLTKFSANINFGSFAANTDIVRLDLININSSYMRFDDLSDKGTKIKGRIVNFNNNGLSVQLVNTANADLNVIDSNLSLYSEYNTKFNTFSPKVQIIGGEFTGSDLFNLPSGVTNSRIRLNNVNITASDISSNMTNRAAKAKFVGCNYNFASWITLWSSSTAVNTGSTTMHYSAGICNFVVGYGNSRRTIEINVATAATYTLETGVTVAVTISGSTATITLNATNANLIGFIENI